MTCDLFIRRQAFSFSLTTFSNQNQKNKERTRKEHGKNKTCLSTKTDCNWIFFLLFSSPQINTPFIISHAMFIFSWFSLLSRIDIFNEYLIWNQRATVQEKKLYRERECRAHTLRIYSDLYHE